MSGSKEIMHRFDELRENLTDYRHTFQQTGTVDSADQWHTESPHGSTEATEINKIHMLFARLHRKTLEIPFPN